MSSIVQIKAKLESLCAEASQHQFNIISGDSDSFLILNQRTGTYFSFSTSVPNDRIVRTLTEEPMPEQPLTKVVFVN